MSVRLYLGDAREVLAGLPEGSVHVVCTSPPYWGLRDYGGDPVVWGGEGGCVHEWGSEERPFHPGQVEQSKWKTAVASGVGSNAPAGCFCLHCGAWRGKLGLEPTPDLFVSHLCEIIDVGLRRVLRKDGLLWLNLGDCYAQARGHGHWEGRGGKGDEHGQKIQKRWRDMDATDIGVKPKDLTGIPWMAAFAMRRRGWYLRGGIPWVKKNGMPSSVTDRPTTTVEYVFLLAHPDSGGRYFYDVNAVRLAPTTKPQRRLSPRDSHAKGGRIPPGGSVMPPRYGVMLELGLNNTPEAGRQLRDADFFFNSLRAILDDSAQVLLHDDDGSPIAFTANPGGGARWEFCNACGTYYEGSECTPLKENDRKCSKCGSSTEWVQHFAIWPISLVSPMIRVSTSEKGVCPTCGAPWIRVTGDSIPVEGRSSGNVKRKLAGEAHNDRMNTHIGSSIPWSPTATPTEGWSPSCSCPTADPVPATVLDPFAGAGTTLLVARDLGRSGVYIDAQLGYLRASHARLLRQKERQ